VGGTTTDIALIQNGQVAISEQGATVAGYKTSVGAANLLSIGLGCDSHITLDRKKVLCIGPERVVPLAYLSACYPQVHNRLKALARRSWTQSTPDWLEHWYLIREPQDPSLLGNARERELVELLRQGPIPVPEILENLQLLHIAQLGADELIRQEIIGKSGLTPTDLLHAEGRYSPWYGEASEMALQFFCHSQLV
jgi:N-methylhydantoinase A/oxoprolinase/acetone carboxylase beta subunit